MAKKKQVKRNSGGYQAPASLSRAASKSASRTVRANPANQMESDRLALETGEGQVVRAAMDPDNAIRQPDRGGNITTTEDGLTLVSMGDPNVVQPKQKAKAKKKVSRRQALEARNDEVALQLLEQERMKARLRERSTIQGL